MINVPGSFSLLFSSFFSKLVPPEKAIIKLYNINNYLFLIKKIDTNTISF